MISNKTDSVYNIKIDPGSFNIKFDISNTNEKWLINLSEVDIPSKAKILLQLGQHFNLSNNLTNKERITCEFIKHVEHNLFKADEDICKSVRNETSYILKS